MYKPPFSMVKRSAAAPPPVPANHARGQNIPNGSKQIECPVITKNGAGPAKAAPQLKLVDPRLVKQNQRNADRGKDIVNVQGVTMSEKGDKENPNAIPKDEKTHVFMVFPEECTATFIDKRSGLAYDRVCLIGVNGRQWPLFPGNNRAPGFVYEALEDNREMKRRYKSKIAPPYSSGRTVLFNDPRSMMARTQAAMRTNQGIFADSMLGRPNYYDVGINAQATQMIKSYREKARQKQV